MVRSSLPAHALRFGLVTALVLSGLAFIASTVPISSQAQQGTILIDTMDDPAGGLLTEETPDPSLYRFDYENGQYIIEAFAPDFAGVLFSYLQTNSLDNTRMTIEVSLSEPAENRFVFAGCRAGIDHDGYLFEVIPDAGVYRWWRMEGDRPVQLGEEGTTDTILSGSQVITIGIECLDTLITGIINDQPVGTVSDATYLSGYAYIGAGMISGSTGPMRATFDNLEVELLGTLGPGPSPTPEPTTGPQPPAPPEPPAPTEQPPEPPAPPAPPDQPTPTPGSAVEPDPAAAVAIEEAIAISQTDAPAFGPVSAAPSLEGRDGAVYDSGVGLIEFYAEITVAAPVNPPPGDWGAGFCFWPNAEDDCLMVLVYSDGARSVWSITGRDDLGGRRILGEGGANALNPTAGALNTIGLVVSDDRAHLLVNEQFTGTVSLPAPPERGDVELIAVFAPSASSPAGDPSPLILPIPSFTIWAIGDDRAGGALQPTPAAPTPAQPTAVPTGAAEPTTVPMTPTPDTPQPPSDAAAQFTALKTQAMQSPTLAGPFTGPLTQETGQVNFAGAGISVSNFYASSAFSNPADTSVPWDVSIGFRHAGGDSQLRLVVSSNGRWSISVGPAAPYASGAVSQFNLTPGQENLIELVAQGNVGYLAVNGLFVAQLDLSPMMAAGDVYVASGVFSDHVVDGRSVEYRRFQVWGLPQ